MPFSKHEIHTDKNAFSWLFGWTLHWWIRGILWDRVLPSPMNFQKQKSSLKKKMRKDLYNIHMYIHFICLIFIWMLVYDVNKHASKIQNSFHFNLQRSPPPPFQLKKCWSAPALSFLDHSSIWTVFFSVCRVLVNVGIERVVVRNIPSPILQIPQRDDMNTSMYAEIGAAALWGVGSKPQTLFCCGRGSRDRVRDPPSLDTWIFICETRSLFGELNRASFPKHVHPCMHNYTAKKCYVL